MFKYSTVLSTHTYSTATQPMPVMLITYWLVQLSAVFTKRYKICDCILCLGMKRPKYTPCYDRQALFPHITALILHPTKSYKGLIMILSASVFFRASVSATSSCWPHLTPIDDPYSTASYTADTTLLASVNYNCRSHTNISVSSSTISSSIHPSLLCSIPSPPPCYPSTRGSTSS